MDLSGRQPAPLARWLARRGDAGRPLFYGWVMLPVATAGLICTSPGQTFMISVFNPSWREALALSHTELAAAYMFGTLIASLPQPLFGAWMDRHGPRRTMIGVVLGVGAACLFCAGVQSLTGLFVAFLALRMLGQGALGLVSGNALAMWFERRLGLVSGVNALGMATAIAILPGIGLKLIEAVGWRATYAWLGIAVWCIMLPLLLLVAVDRPEDLGQQPDGCQPGGEEPAHDDAGPSAPWTYAQAARSRPFWIVGLCVATWAMTTTAVLFHILPIFAGRGLTEGQAGLLYGKFALSLATSQLVAGALADRVSLNRLLASSMVIQAASMAVLRWAPAASVPWAAALTLGVGQGILLAVGSTLWARYYGRDHLGRIQGTMRTVMVASSSVGPLLAGTARDHFGSFDQVLVAFCLMIGALAPLALLAGPPRRSQA